MADLWPWLAVAGLGALHGLNPAGGWMWAAAWAVHSHDRAQALRALLPIAAGHLVSVALVASAVAFGLSMDRQLLQAAAGGLLLVVVAVHLGGRTTTRARLPAGRIGLALWSFMMATGHGAGLMLVPALIPLCAAEAGPGPPGALMPALAAVAVHTAAMLAVTAVLGIAACGRVDAAVARLRRGRRTPPRSGGAVYGQGALRTIAPHARRPNRFP